MEDIEKITADAAGKETLEKVGAIKGEKVRTYYNMHIICLSLWNILQLNYLFQIHVGRNVWIKKSKYDLVLVTAKTPQMFINSLAEASFGFQTLINSSVTGKVSNRTKKLNPNARPCLNPQIICAIQGG